MKLFALAAFLLSATSALANSQSATEAYNNLSGEGLKVQYTHEGRAVVGASITEKSTPTMICQKALVMAPAAEPVFRCFQKVLVDQSAKGTMDAFDGNVLDVAFYDQDANRLVGARVQQKFVKGGFCRKTGAVVPRPIYSYACYLEMN